MGKNKAILNVCYSANEQYVPKMAVSIVSLFENNKNYKEINVYILECDNFSKQTQDNLLLIAQMYDRKITIVSLLNQIQKISNYAATAQFFLGAYGRFYIGDVLPLEVEYCLYLDGDTIICREIELYEITNNDVLVGAVCDTWFQSYNKMIGLSIHDLYFNSGVLWINLKKWREEGWVNQLVAHLTKLTKPYRLNDQDIINIVLRDKITKLPLKYNMLYITRMYKEKWIYKFSEKDEKTFYSKNEIQEAKSSPVIIHFAGYFMGKPWYQECIDKDAEIWKKYARLCIPYKDNLIEHIKKPKTRMFFRLKSILPLYIMWRLDYFLTKKSVR